MAMARSVMPPTGAPAMPIAVIERGMDGTDYGYFQFTASNGMMLAITGGRMALGRTPTGTRLRHDDVLGPARQRLRRRRRRADM